MNFYEHTIIARQDTSPAQLKQIQDRYLTVKVKKLDLKTNYFEKKSEEVKEKSN